MCEERMDGSYFVKRHIETSLGHLEQGDTKAAMSAAEQALIKAQDAPDAVYKDAVAQMKSVGSYALDHDDFNNAGHCAQLIARHDRLEYGNGQAAHLFVDIAATAMDKKLYVLAIRAHKMAKTLITPERNVTLCADAVYNQIAEKLGGDEAVSRMMKQAANTSKAAPKKTMPQPR